MEIFSSMLDNKEKGGAFSLVQVGQIKQFEDMA